MIRILYFLRFAVFAIVSLSLLLPSGEAEEPFVVGAIMPLSGPSASLGYYIQKGIQLAYQELPQESKERFKVVYEDDAWESSRAVAAFHKLFNTHNIGAVIVVGSGIGHAVAPLAEQRGVVMISVGASDAQVVKDRRFAFLHWIIPEIEAQVLVDEIVRRGYQRLGYISSEQQGYIAVYDAVMAEFKKRGLKNLIVLDETYLPTQSDFRVFAAKARSKNIDGVITGLFPEGIPAFAKEMRRSNPKADLIGLEIFEDQAVVDASQGALLNQWYVNADSPDSKFEDSYKKVFGIQPGWAAANAYDSLKLLYRAAIENNLRGKQIADFLGRLQNYTGAAGRYSATGDNRFTLPVAVKIITDHGFVKASAE